MKSLSDAANEYLCLRRALGYKLRHHTWWLPDFVAFLQAHRSAVITTELAVEWACQPVDTSPNWWSRRLSAVRLFARHHHAADPRTQIPPADLIPYRRQRKTPYLYSADEVATLMRAASQLSPPLMATSYASIIGLLAVTGMRVSEALDLNRDDVDCKRQLLTVHSSKFGKSRHVPLHSTTAEVLCRYARKRDKLRPHRRSSAFFLSSTGNRVLLQNFGHVFIRLIEHAGVGRGCSRRPRIHDLRHTFAMKLVHGWYRAGLDVEPRLPWLSTYLGHVSPVSTYWYLTATPDLLAAACVRAGRAWKRRP